MSFDQDPNERANISGADLAILIDELKAAKAEVARLKVVPMKYRRMEFNAALRTENEALREKVAHYDKWLSDGIYFTTEEFRKHCAENDTAMIERKRLYDELLAAKAEAAQWKNNHDNRVKAARALVERHDIPVERLRYHDEFLAMKEEIARLNLAVKSYSEGQAWYVNALEKLRPIRYHANELLEQMDSHNRFAKAVDGVPLSQTVIDAAKVAIEDANKFFSGSAA